MTKIVSDTPRIVCPNWCTTDHTLDLAELHDPAHWVVHDSAPSASASW